VNPIPEEIRSRLDRLERDLNELSRTVSRPLGGSDRRGGDGAASRISLVTWLQITGPTFAALVFGFSLLWNSQQATTAQLLEVNRSLGRLDGSLSALDARIERLGDSVERLSERVERPGAS
jgi:hypothetical protein